MAQDANIRDYAKCCAIFNSRETKILIYLRSLSLSLYNLWKRVESTIYNDCTRLEFSQFNYSREEGAKDLESVARGRATSLLQNPGI